MISRETILGTLLSLKRAVGMVSLLAQHLGMMLSLLSQGLRQVISWMKEGVLKLMGEGVKENLQWGTNWCCEQLPKQLLLKLLQQQRCWSSLTLMRFAQLLNLVRKMQQEKQL